MPNTQTFVVNGTMRENTSDFPESFLSYDLDTSEFKVLPFVAPDDFLVVSSLRFSPDGKYLAYSGERGVVVEFATGVTIQESVGGYWVDNQTLISKQQVGERQYRIVSVDVVSGQVTTLVDGEAAAGMLLFP
ncbi:MAG: hypothetical protein H7Y11_11075 [Armatimonadetes bacterium]|nr:hypothetical protein [Anaerolineae bacterium]